MNGGDEEEGNDGDEERKEKRRYRMKGFVKISSPNQLSAHIPMQSPGLIGLFLQENFLGYVHVCIARFDFAFEFQLVKTTAPIYMLSVVLVIKFDLQRRTHANAVLKL